MCILAVHIITQILPERANFNRQIQCTRCLSGVGDKLSVLICVVTRDHNTLNLTYTKF